MLSQANPTRLVQYNQASPTITYLLTTIMAKLQQDPGLYRITRLKITYFKPTKTLVQRISWAQANTTHQQPPRIRYSRLPYNKPYIRLGLTTLPNLSLSYKTLPLTIGQAILSIFPMTGAWTQARLGCYALLPLPQEMHSTNHNKGTYQFPGYQAYRTSLSFLSSREPYVSTTQHFSEINMSLKIPLAVHFSKRKQSYNLQTSKRHRHESSRLDHVIKAFAQGTDGVCDN